MSRRTGAWLAAGAVTAVAFKVVVTVVPSPAPSTAWIITSSAVGFSFLAAGLAAWPANRLGLLFSIVGYLWLAPNVGYLPYARPSRSATRSLGSTRRRWRTWRSRGPPGVCGPASSYGSSPRGPQGNAGEHGGPQATARRKLVHITRDA